jgi:hypothetical protein
MMKSPRLPDPETWDAMSAEEQWAFMEYSAAVAAYNRQCARRWRWITWLFRRRVDA